MSIKFSLEVFPPKVGANEAHHWAAIDAFCKLEPEFISITCGAFGNHALLDTDIAEKVRAKKVTPAIHFTCLGKTREDAVALATEYKESKFERIIALRGDYPMNGTAEMLEELKKRKDSLQHAVQLVEILAELKGFDVSVACYPEKHPEAKDMREDIQHLKEKLDAGAERAITQFFCDPDTYLRFRDQVAKVGIDKPIVPGILPILNIDKFIKMANKCEVQVPDFLVRMYKDVPRDSVDHKLLAMNILSHQITRLITEGVDFFHLYTLDDTMLNTHICHWLKEGF